jgi:hypothetical protein
MAHLDENRSRQRSTKIFVTHPPPASYRIRFIGGDYGEPQHSWEKWELIP